MDAGTAPAFGPAPAPGATAAAATHAAAHSLKALVVTFLPGAVQGATTVMLGHPLDTAKTRMQASGPNAHRSALRTMARMVTEEGPRSLFRGCTPPLLMEGLKRSVQFALWDFFRDVHAQERTGGAVERPWLATQGRAAVAAVGGNPFLSGAVAGGIGTTIGCPMHVIKIRTQYQTREGTRNAWTCTADIYRADGLRGFYRGFKYNLLKDLCFAGAYLGMYGWLRERWGCTDPTTAGSGASMATRAFLAGASASVATWVLLYPLDTLKTLVQAGQQHRISPHLLRQQPSRLYRGLAASLLKAGPVSGASMCVYELVKQRVDRW